LLRVFRAGFNPVKVNACICTIVCTGCVQVVYTLCIGKFGPKRSRGPKI